MRRWYYRVQQFWHQLTAVEDQTGMDEARQVLSPPLMDLFLRMQAGEQAHSMRVFRGLRAQSETNPDLLAAALLHDVGKSVCPLNIWERVLVVLLQKAAPRAVKSWGESACVGLRKPFVVAAQHPHWGAELALQAGASPEVASLIRRHHQEPLLETGKMDCFEDQLLTRLQRVDHLS